MKLYIIGVVVASLNFVSVFIKAFTLVPTNVGVAPREQAIFHCQYLTADYVLWHVNGTVVRRNYHPDITPGTTRDDNDELVDTLTITAHPEYNGTEVVCVAGFDDGRPEEPSGTVFLLVGRFLRSPMSLNVTDNMVVNFQCQNPAADAIDWMINGSTNFPEYVYSEKQGNILFLNITARSEYNQTVITCKAYFRNSPVQETEPAVMTIQGSLRSVTELQRNSSTLSWEPPFSHDLTDVDPDIIYCVVVYNITCGGRDLIISDCNVTEPSYTSNIITPCGFIYEYTVSPRSNVEGARNGTNWTVTEHFYHLSMVPRGQQNVKENGSLCHVTLTLDIDYGGQEPLLFHALLYSADSAHHKNGSIEPVDTKRESNGQNIILEVPNLPSQRVFDIVLVPNTCYGYPLTGLIEIGTHDLYAISVTVTSFHPYVVQVMGDIVDGSSSLGILTIVYSDSLVKYNFVPNDETRLGVYNVTVCDLTNGEYEVAVFIMEKNGKPFPRAVSRPKDIKINGAGEVLHQNVYVAYELHPSLTGVCITCTFLDNSATDCVAVVHQRISQLSSSGLMNIESSHKFTRSGDTAYGCIEGVNLEHYQVGVVNAKMIISADDAKASTMYIVISVLVSLATVAAVTVIVIVILLKSGKLKHWTSTVLIRRQSVCEYSIHNLERAHTKENIYVVVDQPIKTKCTTKENSPLLPDKADFLQGDEPQTKSYASPIASPPVHLQTAIFKPVVAEGTSPDNKETMSMYNSEIDHQPIPAPPMDCEDSEIHLKNLQSTATQQVIPKTTSEYSEMVHPQQTQVKSYQQRSDPVPPTPFTMENIVIFLYPLASKLQSLGEALSVDKEQLDEMFNNNEIEEGLLKMLEHYMENCDFMHTWKEMATILGKIDESTIAEKIQELHIRPYTCTNSLPEETEEILDTGRFPARPVQCKHGDDLALDDCGPEKQESSFSSNQDLHKPHDSSGMVSQEQRPSESDCDQVKSPCSCEPVEVLDQPYKTEADLGGTVETVLPGDVNPVPPLLKTFGMPGYFPELKTLYEVTHEPMTTELLHNNRKPGEIVLPRTGSITARQMNTEVNISTKDKEVTTAESEELVTGIHKINEA